MPVIQITSLPFAETVDIPAVLRRLSALLAEALAIDVRHIAITWQFLPSGHYADGGVTIARQPHATHPLRVDVLLPDRHRPGNLAKILDFIAEELAKSVTVARENIFIHLRTAHSGTVFDAGSIVEWPAINGGIPMTDRTKRSGNERRTDEDRRQANDPNSSPEERRSGIERRSGEDRRRNNE